jgi:translation initiation factor IF-1
MVKNSKGGCKSKRMARKHVNSGPQRSVRKITEDGEMYAIVVKHFGGQCEVVTTDGVTRMCILRGKFKGRSRRDNNMAQGSWVMIGIREWEVRGDGKTKCDLLCVYSDIERDELKQNSDVKFTELEKVNTEMTGVTVDNNVAFKDDKTSDYENIMLDADNLEVDEVAEDDEVGEDDPQKDGVPDEYVFDVDDI